MSKKYFTIILAFLALFLTACGGGNTPQKAENTSLQVQRIVFGVAQKGPVIEGGSVLVYELDANAERTGRVLQTRTFGKQGNFAFKPPASWGDAVEVIFSGRYFNEAIGHISTDTINLSTIILLPDNTQVSANINILSTMVAARVRSLLRQNKLSIKEAISLASASLKTITGVSGRRTNSIDITKSALSQDNAIALFISGIIVDLANKYQIATQQLINQLASNFAIDGQLSGVAKNWRTRLKDLALNREKIYTDKYSSRLSRYIGDKTQIPFSSSLPDAVTFTARPTAVVKNNLLLVEPNTLVTLDGSNSESENGKSIKYTWFQTDHGNAVTLTNRFGAKLSFTSPNSEDTTLQFTLLVTDSDGMSDHQVVTVITAKFKPSIKGFIGADKEGNTFNNTILVDEGGSVDLKLQINNPIGKKISYRLRSAPSYGEVLFSSSAGTGNSPVANLRYKHDGLEERSDAFVFEVMDAKGNTATLRVNVIIRPVNDPPNAKDDYFQITAGDTLKGNVLLNDSDSEGDKLTAILIGEGLDLKENGDFSYVLNEDIQENIQKVFHYKVSDGHGGVSEATITIAVTPIPNNAPVAANDSFYTLENIPVILNVLENDTDPDGDALLISGFDQPAHGELVITDYSLKYTPDTGFSGSDSFSYTISDSRSGQASATVQIAVINTKPIAHSQSLTTEQNTALDFQLTGEDADGDELTFEVPAITEAGGVLTHNAGSVHYTPPNNNFSGIDRFSFRVNDGEESSLSATVTISVEEITQKPIAIITELPKSIYEGKQLILDASQSSSQ
ncbi:MAG: hypothetical protein DSZ29_00195, partial [Aquificaceae bacterium]